MTRAYQIPGGPVLLETGTQAYQIPGGPVVLETAAAAPTTYEYTGVGGAATGGAAAVSKLKVFGAAGGATGSGTATRSRTKAFAGSGGSIAGGSAAVSFVKAAVGAGGAVIGGAALTARLVVHSWVAVGGAQTAGAALAAKVKHYTGTDGAAAGGSATLARIKANVGVGGVTCGGAASVSTVRAFVSSGGATAGGPAHSAQIKAHLGSGGATAGGSAEAFFETFETLQDQLNLLMNAVADLTEHIRDLHLLHGLQSAFPLTVTGEQRTAGAITQEISEAGGTTVVSRLDVPEGVEVPGGLTPGQQAAWLLEYIGLNSARIYEVCQIHGLDFGNSLNVSLTARSTNSIQQSIVEQQNGAIVVTRT